MARMPSATKATPMRISRAPRMVFGCRGRGFGSELAAMVPTVTRDRVPTTQPIRYGSADRFRLSESRMRMVIRMGTELTAAATPRGIRDSKACPIALQPAGVFDGPRGAYRHTAKRGRWDARSQE